ncbi:unnamed protein product [Phytophthora fragariaefolia]|uniref:Unnamed protein product n=1 Tax=Phytophthora fragariaefolia TaxID=1490495 RepID=A0A9W7DBP0_9STRA|nr:unnamed protein product [Phytophthora fragariaefolia]
MFVNAFPELQTQDQDVGQAEEGERNGQQTTAGVADDEAVYQVEAGVRHNEQPTATVADDEAVGQVEEVQQPMESMHHLLPVIIPDDVSDNSDGATQNNPTQETSRRYDYSRVVTYIFNDDGEEMNAEIEWSNNIEPVSHLHRTDRAIARRLQVQLDSRRRQERIQIQQEDRERRARNRAAGPSIDEF